MLVCTNIRTATLSRNEVGDAIKKSGIDRSEFFVTTKVLGPPESLDSEETYQSLVKAVEKFGLGKYPFLSKMCRLHTET